MRLITVQPDADVVIEQLLEKGIEFFVTYSPERTFIVIDVAEKDDEALTKIYRERNL